MTTLRTPAEAGGGGTVPVRRSRALLFVLAGNMLIDALEVSVVLVALPSIGGELRLSLTSAQWLLTGFALGFAALLLAGPAVTARWGRRRSYLAALLVFAAASVVGGTTDSAALLIATRVVKGACAALTAPTGLAIINDTFREGPEQRRAVSVYALSGAAGFTAGVLLSGALTGTDWHWTFLFPAPVALILLLLAARLVPSGAKGGAADGRPGRQRRLLMLLRNGTLLRSALGAASLNGTYVGLLFLLVHLLQRQLGWSPWACALALLPACLPPALAAPFAARLVALLGTARPIALGAVAASAGYALQLRPHPPSGYLTGVLPTLVLVGLAFVLSFAPLNMQAFSGVPGARKAQAVPLYQTGVQLGAVLVLPVVSALLSGPGYRAAALCITAVSLLGLAAALPGLITQKRSSR